MKQLPNGDWLLDDGRTVKADDIGRQYENKNPKKKPDENQLNLEEGACSGPIRLED
jgi:hypothetical protein